MITEFAILHLSPHTTTVQPWRSTLQLLTDAIAVQDAWHATHFPHLPSAAADRAAAWFTQLEDPSQIMTTARWKSVAAHWDWIRSAENQRIMKDLEGDIVPGNTVLFHVGADLFDGVGALLLLSEVVSVSRVFVAKGDRKAFADVFEAVRGVLEEYASPGLVRFGWREDVEVGADEDEFVIVCGWESVERHLEFSKCQGFSKYGEIWPFIARTDLKHYKRVL